MEEIIIYAHTNIAPFCLSALLVCAAVMNEVTSYLFLVSFLMWFSITVSRVALLIYQKGILRWIWETIKSHAEAFWQQVLRLKDLYWIKVIIGVLVPFVAASSGYWFYYHVDLLKMIKSTLEFLVQIPAYLLDSRLLIQAIHRWLHSVLLDNLAYLMGTIWENSKNIIIAHPTQGAFIIALGLGAIYTLFIAGSLMQKGYDLARDYIWPGTGVQPQAQQTDARISTRTGRHQA